jgi:hypothetical protein
MPALVTAAIAAMWVENRVESNERRMEHDVLRALHAEIGALRKEIAELRTARDRAKETGHQC